MRTLLLSTYLPIEVTSLIQPMDHGVLESLKCRYKNKLLHRLLIEEENGMPVVDALKTIDMKVELASEAWDEISPATLCKTWQKIKILSPVPHNLDEHSMGTNDGSEQLTDSSDDADFTCMFDSLDFPDRCCMQISQHGLIVTILILAVNSTWMMRCVNLQWKMSPLKGKKTWRRKLTKPAQF